MTCNKNQDKEVKKIITEELHKCPNCNHKMVYIETTGDIPDYYWCENCKYEEDI